jgi:HK97 family phage major capsid protein
VPEIFSVDNTQPGMFQLARRYNVPGRSLRIPYLVQDEGTSVLNRPMAGKIANVTIVGEGVTKPTREPTFGQRLLTMFKYAAISQFGDELLGDDFTGELPAEVTAAVGGQIVNKINEDVTQDGGGTTEPVGALNAANTALLSVNRAVAGTFSAADAFAMYERHTHGPNSVWMVTRRGLSKLFALQTTNNTMVTWLANLRDKPQMLLLGLPVIVTDLLPSVGTKGDFALVNPDFYAMGLRQALTVESSIHVAFVNDVTTYRFVARAGGIPIPTGTFAYKVNAQGAKVDEHSPFVVLDVVASS